MRLGTAVFVAALAAAATGVSISRAVEPDGSPLGPGVAILAAAALVAAVVGRWWGVLSGFAALALVLTSRIGAGLDTDLSGERGGGAAVGSWLLVAGSALAVAVGAPFVLRRLQTSLSEGATAGESDSAHGARGGVLPGRQGHVRLVMTLMLLSAICAEDLAAYDDTTGRPLELVAGAVVFGFLYGGPALLIREFVRRTGRGWPAILLLATAAGVVEAGLIDQSLFNDRYRDIESWDELYEPTHVGGLGLSVFAAQSFVVGHLVYSFSAPIALTEAMRPAAARLAWVGRRGLSIVALLYLAVAGVVLGDTLANEPVPSVAQIVGTVALVAALVGLVLMTGPEAPKTMHRNAPRSYVVLGASFVLATLLAIAPSTWLGVALSAAVLLMGGFVLVRASQGVGWGTPHLVALAAGAVLSRGLLAFSYYPVIGEVSAARKYAHNAVMLLIVSIAIAVAWRGSRCAEAGGEIGSAEPSGANG